MSNELRPHNKHKMSPSPSPSPNHKNNESEKNKKIKTREEIDIEAELADIEINKKTDKTLENILNKVHKQINLENIKITKTDQKHNTDKTGNHYG